MRSDLAEQARVWERMFFQTPEERSLADQDWSWLTERLRREGVQTVLDLGCGRGHGSVALARAGFRVTAVDISPLAIARLRAWAEEEKLPIVAQVGAAQELPLGWSFDAVIAHRVLDHMFKGEAEEAVRRIRAVLRPGGLLLLGLDGPPDEEDKAWPHVVFPDGTWQFFGGRRDGLLWRFWPDEEVVQLLSGFRLEEREVQPDGRRRFWARRV
ncbi:MAG: class I SAM-dependent methyltransferase [Candidatus Bipolaricaulota bacterium]|nr:class I SAM-dependent methyltransferase [Candidatus Bipolaricaulota bacterium]MDW8152438.1 class I SAM-dependent methyltransferase [Candidatus Bipolaricaulota bacterium]